MPDFYHIRTASRFFCKIVIQMHECRVQTQAPLALCREYSFKNKVTVTAKKRICAHQPELIKVSKPKMQMHQKHQIGQHILTASVTYAAGEI